jgi:hypothetical protein
LAIDNRFRALELTDQSNPIEIVEGRFSHDDDPQGRWR